MRILGFCVVLEMKGYWFLFGESGGYGGVGVIIFECSYCMIVVSINLEV